MLLPYALIYKPWPSFQSRKPDAATGKFAFSAENTIFTTATQNHLVVRRITGRANPIDSSGFDTTCLEGVNLSLTLKLLTTHTATVILTLNLIIILVERF